MSDTCVVDVVPTNHVTLMCILLVTRQLPITSYLYNTLTRTMICYQETNSLLADRSLWMVMPSLHDPLAHD